MSIDNAVASNWVLEKFSRTPEGFSLRGTTKGYASFSRAFKQGATVFYAASDDQGNREAGYGTYRDNMITDITVTATLVGGAYSEGNPPRVNFRNGGTIGGTFNALAFNTLWNRKDGNGAGMVISEVEPGDPIEGMQWLDSTTAEVWIWDGEKWLEFPTGDVGANVQIEDFPPSNPKLGDMWTDYGTTGELYIWDGRYWVSMTGDGGPKVILGGEGGGDIDLPENITLDNLEDPGHADKALARHISSGGVGKWLPIKTGDVETDPDVTFRDAKGRFKSTKQYEDLTDQLKVNRFLAGELESQGETLEQTNAGLVRIDNQVAENTSNIIQLQESAGNIDIPEYDDSELRALIEELPVTVSTEPPEINKDGELWYDDERLELFVSYQDGWISTTPLAARVEAGEALQAEILARVEAGEAKQVTIESNAMTKGGAQTLTEDHWSIKTDDGKTYAMISEGEITMYHVAEPEAPKQIANREYVDTKIAKKGDTMTGNLAMAGHQITGLGTPKQRGHTVSKGYMDDTLAPLEAKINQLEGSIGEYHWNYENNQNNAREGNFNAKTQDYHLTDLVSETVYFEFNLTDSDGKNPDFTRLLDGDVLRITGPAGERAEWYVRAGSDGSNGVLLLGDLISSTFDEFVVGVVYGVTGLSQFDPSGLATIDYVDEKHDANREYAETKISLTGTNVVDTSWRLKNGGATVLSTSTSGTGKLKIYNLDYPSHPEHAANMRYVDDAVAGRKWKWHQASNNTYGSGSIFYYDVDSVTRQFAIHGNAETGGSIKFIPQLESENQGKELLTISGIKDGKKTFIAIVQVRSWVMTDAYIVVRCNKADFRHWEPESFADRDLVTVEYGGLF